MHSVTGLAGAILPDGCRLVASTTDGITTFRYREFFRKKEYFGMEREMLIERTIYSLEPLIKAYDVEITRGVGWVEVSGKVQRDTFAKMMLGEFSHWSHDDLVEIMGRAGRERVRDGVKARSKRPKAPLTEGEKTLSDAMLKALTDDKVVIGVEVKSKANQVANVGQLIQCPMNASISNGYVQRCCLAKDHAGECLASVMSPGNWKDE